MKHILIIMLVYSSTGLILHAEGIKHTSMESLETELKSIDEQIEHYSSQIVTLKNRRQELEVQRIEINAKLTLE